MTASAPSARADRPHAGDAPERVINASERRAFERQLVAQHFLGDRLVSALTRGGPQRLQQRMAARLATHGKARFHEVEARSCIEPDEFRERYLEPGVPLILRGAAQDWPCTKRWSFDFFRQGYGQVPVLLQNMKGLSVAGEGAPAQKGLAEAIVDMEAGGPTYVRFGTVVSDHPELLGMLDLCWLETLRGATGGAAGTNFFLGRQGTVTPLHAAFTCNLFVMVQGRKRWTLYPAASSAALRPTTGGQYYHSAADPFAPDPERWPALPHVDGYRFELEQGDVLYNPPYMWHYVENLTPTIGLGYRFTHWRSALRASAALLLLRALAWDPPPWRSLAALRNPRSLFTPDFNPPARRSTRS